MRACSPCIQAHACIPSCARVRVTECVCFGRSPSPGCYVCTCVCTCACMLVCMCACVSVCMCLSKCATVCVSQMHKPTSSAPPSSDSQTALGASRRGRCESVHAAFPSLHTPQSPGAATTTHRATNTRSSLSSICAPFALSSHCLRVFFMFLFCCLHCMCAHCLYVLLVCIAYTYCLYVLLIRTACMYYKYRLYVLPIRTACLCFRILIR